MSDVNATNFSNDSKELVSEVKSAISDAEEFLRETADVAGDKLGELRGRIADRLHDARMRIADAEETLLVRTKAAARATDVYVNENPWRAAGIAAAIGLLLGVIIGRR
jgi:ElaB/YqjD/DUF883 family membrane-anchored ribosome-binding protein